MSRKTYLIKALLSQLASENQHKLFFFHGEELTLSQIAKESQVVYDDEANPTLFHFMVKSHSERGDANSVHYDVVDFSTHDTASATFKAELDEYLKSHLHCDASEAFYENGALVERGHVATHSIEWFKFVSPEDAHSFRRMTSPDD